MALEFFPNTSNLKCAILYGTRYGSTRDAALWIGEGLGAIAQVYDAREKPDLSGYDHLIIGTGIYGGKAAEALEEYLTQNASKLAAKVRALFVVCGQGPAGLKDYGAMLKGLVKAEPALVQAFSGRTTLSLFEPDVYKMMQEYYKKNNRPWADSDNLSRPDCLKFGKEILAALKK
jgi:hypothetical protein